MISLRLYESARPLVMFTTAVCTKKTTHQRDFNTVHSRTEELVRRRPISFKPVGAGNAARDRERRLKDRENDGSACAGRSRCELTS